MQRKQDTNLKQWPWPIDHSLMCEKTGPQRITMAVTIPFGL